MQELIQTIDTARAVLVEKTNTIAAAHGNIWDDNLLDAADEYISAIQTLDEFKESLTV